MNITTLTRLPLAHREMSLTGCCPMFVPSEWDNKLFEFDRKLFVKVTSHSIMHMPLDVGRMMRLAHQKIGDAGAETDEFAILSHEASPWYTNHFITVSKPVPDMETVELSGAFLSRVFEGPYRDATSWYEQLVNYAIIRNKIPIETYFYYTTCPRCAKVYGKNYVVGLERVEYPDNAPWPAALYGAK